MRERPEGRVQLGSEHRRAVARGDRKQERGGPEQAKQGALRTI